MAINSDFGKRGPVMSQSFYLRYQRKRVTKRHDDLTTVCGGSGGGCWWFVTHWNLDHYGCDDVDSLAPQLVSHVRGHVAQRDVSLVVVVPASMCTTLPAVVAKHDGNEMVGL